MPFDPHLHKLNQRVMNLRPSTSISRYHDSENSRGEGKRARGAELNQQFRPKKCSARDISTAQRRVHSSAFGTQAMPTLEHDVSPFGER